MDEQIVEIVKWSPVMGGMLYLLSIYARALVERDKRIDELIDRCLGKSPCDDENKSATNE